MSDYYPPLSCLSDSHKCVFETLTGYMHVLERRMWDTTVLGVSVRVLFPNGQRTAANAHEHTHTHTHLRTCIHSVWNWELFCSQRSEAVSCVCDCLCFSRPEIASLTVSHSTVPGGEDWTWCERGTPAPWVHLTLILFVVLMMPHSWLVAFYQDIIKVFEVLVSLSIVVFEALLLLLKLLEFSLDFFRWKCPWLTRIRVFCMSSS